MAIDQKWRQSSTYAHGNQDGGGKTAAEGVDKLHVHGQKDNWEPELVISHEERLSSDGSGKEGNGSDGEDIFVGQRG